MRLIVLGLVGLVLALPITTAAQQSSGSTQEDREAAALQFIGKNQFQPGKSIARILEKVRVQFWHADIDGGGYGDADLKLERIPIILVHIRRL